MWHKGNFIIFVSTTRGQNSTLVANLSIGDNTTQHDSLSQNLNSNNGCDVLVAHIGAISSANATPEKVESVMGKDEGENATSEKVETVLGEDEGER